jgi:hypothetical protein
MLVEVGGDSLIEFRSKGGSPLHAAISCEAVEKDEATVIEGNPRPFTTVKCLLNLYKENGNAVAILTNQMDLSGVSPLMLACYVGDLAIVTLLLQNGANPLIASNSENITCLHVCAERGFLEIA